jgi:hypothetical protein
VRVDHERGGHTLAARVDSSHVVSACGFPPTFTREQLRYVVLHELAHLRRSDVLVN